LTTRSSWSRSRPTNPAEFLDLVHAAAHDRVELLHAPRHAHLHVHLLLGRACARGARRGRSDDGGPMSADLQADFDEVRDITVIGAGPVGLSTAFWAGMREASSRVIDSPPRARRPAHDPLPGEVDLRRPWPPEGAGEGPRRAAARAGARAVRRARPPQHHRGNDSRGRAEGEDRVVVLHTDSGELRSRTVIVSGGHGAFEPKKLPGLRT